MSDAGDYEQALSEASSHADSASFGTAPEGSEDGSSEGEPVPDEDLDDLPPEFKKLPDGSEGEGEGDGEDEIKEDFILDADLKDEFDDQLKVDDIYPSLFSGVLSSYEKTAITGFRAQQIASGAEIYVETNNNDTPFTIAERELREGKIPFYIDRKLPNGTYISVKLDQLLDVY